MSTVARIDAAIQAIDQWLDTVDSDDVDGSVEEDEEDLYRLAELLRNDGAQEDVRHAVRTARDHGWAWGPIVLLLGISQHEAQRIYG